jgi:hypothetical protein
MCFCFGKEEGGRSVRDVINERPTLLEEPQIVRKTKEVCVMHTSCGDIRIRLFPEYKKKREKKEKRRKGKR